MLSAGWLFTVKHVLLGTVRIMAIVFSVFFRVWVAIPIQDLTIVSYVNSLSIFQQLFQMAPVSPTPFQTASVTIQAALPNALRALLTSHSTSLQTCANSTAHQAVRYVQALMFVPNVFKDTFCWETEPALNAKSQAVPHVPLMEWHAISVLQDFTPFQKSAECVQGIVQAAPVAHHAQLWSNQPSKCW